MALKDKHQAVIDTLMAKNARLTAENEQLKQQLAKNKLGAGLICPGCGKPADEGQHSILCF